MKRYEWLVLVAFVGGLIGLGFLINYNLGQPAEETAVGAINVDNGDIDIDWNRYDHFDYNLSESITIYKSGTYNLTGKITDGSVKIDAEDGFVKLILDNVSIISTKGPAIYCTNGDTVAFELVGYNYLEDGAKYDESLDKDTNGTIYSKADLSFAGEGTLSLKSNYQDGIVSKDDLNIRNGTFIINAKDDGIRGKDGVLITSADITINADGDGIKSTNSDDAGKGFVYIKNGALSLSVGDDGIHAEKTLLIDDGDINITKSYEGFEAPSITINGGNIAINSSDDGINAGAGTSESNTPRPRGMMDADENCTVTINDGNVYVNASGDGIDSNGYIYINSGKLAVDGPTNNGNGALDAGIEIVTNGGEAIAVGSSGMAESFGTKSSVPNISIYLSSSYKAGSKISIKSASGNTILEHTPAKNFSHIAASSKELVLGETYKLYINDELVYTATLNSISTSNRSAGNRQNMPPQR